MKNRIYKTFGVALALVLVFGLLGAFVPVNTPTVEAQGTTPNRWDTVTTPTTSVKKLRDCDIGDFAVAGDGKTLFAVTTGVGNLGMNNVEPSSSSVWSTDQSHSGSYSALLTVGATGITNSIYVEFTPAMGIPFSVFQADIEADNGQWNWYNYVEAVTGNQAQIELKFTDPASADFFDITFTQHQVLGTETWVKVTVDKDDARFQYWGPVLGSSGANLDFAALLAYNGGALDDSAYDPFLLSRVRVELNEATPERYSYVDDVTINDVNYNLEPSSIFRSTSNGWMWTLLTSPAWAAPPRLVAVAQDDPNAVAVVDSSSATYTAAAGTVWISNNGGTTWATLNRVAGNASAKVTDIAAGPARTGTILDRDYVVTVADTRGNSCVGGDVLYQGFTTTWTSCATGGAFDADKYDFTSVAISPGFLGDRSVVAVGSDVDDTFMLIINIKDDPQVPTVVSPPGALKLEVTAVESPDDLGQSGTGIVVSSVALPADFDPTTTGGMRTYIGWTSEGYSKGDDVWRVDFQTVRKLQSGAAKGIYSIAFSGTISGGTLIAGEAGETYLSTLVYFTNDPQVSQPSWEGSAKSPTGQANCVVGIDPADATLCYGANSGIESAFSVSTNGAVSFNQRGLINTSIDLIHEVMLSPDGSTVFMATSDDASTNTTGTSSLSNRESLWKSKVPTSADSWERVRISSYPDNWGNTGGSSLIRLSPDYLDDGAIYWCDKDGTGIQKSTTGGDIFSTRAASQNIGDLTVENKDIVYFSGTAGYITSVFKSSNGAWFFDLPVDTGFPIFDLEMAPTYPEKPVEGNLIAGTTVGNILYSTNGGALFIPLLPTIPDGAQIQALADVDYATNNIVYAGSSTADKGIWRWEIGVSTTWEQIRGVADDGDIYKNRVMTGLAMHSGTLYGAWYGSTGTTKSGAERTLSPTIPTGDMYWDTMDVGSTAAVFTVAPNALRVAGTETSVSLWAIDTASGGTLMAYDDTMAKAAPTATIPSEVAYDPNSRGNAQFTITWTQISNAHTYDAYICSDVGGTKYVTGPATPPATYRVPVAGAPSWVVPAGRLSAGQDYYLWLRARDQVPGDGIRSGWAEVIKFTVKGGVPIEVTYLAPQILGPAPGAIGVPLSPGFTWSPYLDATKYEFKLANDAALTDIVAEAKLATTAYKYEEKLAYGTTYFWAARALEPIASDWSPVASFTTEKAPPAPPAPVPAPPAPAPPVVTPGIIWAIIAIGAILVIAVIVLILRTRRVA